MNEYIDDARALVPLLAWRRRIFYYVVLPLMRVPAMVKRSSPQDRCFTASIRPSSHRGDAMLEMLNTRQRSRQNASD